MKKISVYLLAALIAALFTVSPVCAAAQPQKVDDVQDKIRAIEEQIRALKEVKMTADKRKEEKALQCKRVVGSKSFCSCLTDELPDEILFDKYVQVMLQGKDVLEGSLRKLADAIFAARDTCVERAQMK